MPITNFGMSFRYIIICHSPIKTIYECISVILFSLVLVLSQNTDDFPAPVLKYVKVQMCDGCMIKHCTEWTGIAVVL
jgi:hypothetical protein